MTTLEAWRGDSDLPRSLDDAHDAGQLGAIEDADFDVWRRTLTAHSTRVGLTQDLFGSGQDFAGIMQALRWKSSA